MKKILVASVLMTSMVNANPGDFDGFEIVESTPLKIKEISASQPSENAVAKNAVQQMNSYTKYGIYVAGRTVETIGNGLSYLGNKIGSFGAGYILLEETIVSNLISPLSYAIQGGLECAAWNASSKAVALPLKDLADTIEAKGAKTSYFSKLAWIATGVGFICSAVGYGLGWLGQKACKYAETN